MSADSLPVPGKDSTSEQTLQPPDGQSGYLWTPWRMAYVAGAASPESGCIFCNRLAADDDIGNLIAFRDERVFAIMNLYPYNTGHLMIVPNQHVSSPEEIASEELSDLSMLMQRALKALRSALRCHGFNIGLNVGVIAGAGVADHIHQHIVPRWSGDANFMPILAGTMVMPEMLPVTYAKVRAELARLQGTRNQCKIICRDTSGTRVGVVTSGGRNYLPSVEITGEIPVWQSAFTWLSGIAVAPRLEGWAGSQRADANQELGLCFVADGIASGRNELQLIPLAEALTALSDSEEAVLILRCLAPDSDGS